MANKLWSLDPVNFVIERIGFLTLLRSSIQPAVAHRPYPVQNRRHPLGRVPFAQRWSCPDRDLSQSKYRV